MIFVISPAMLRRYARALALAVLALPPAARAQDPRANYDESKVGSYTLPNPLVWADPEGEFLAAVAAGPVYELLGKKGFGTDRMPPVNHPIMNDVAYHVRTGKHDVTAYDWDQYLDFADKHLRQGE